MVRMSTPMNISCKFRNQGEGKSIQKRIDGKEFRNLFSWKERERTRNKLYEKVHLSYHKYLCDSIYLTNREEDSKKKNILPKKAFNNTTFNSMFHPLSFNN